MLIIVIKMWTVLMENIFKAYKIKTNLLTYGNLF